MYRNSLPIYDPKKCFLFALGRNAIYAACKILGLGANDEVLTPAFDCDGSLQPFRVLRIKSVFFRSDPYTFAVDIDDIKRKINKKTKLIHIINHFGMPQAWDRLLVLRRETGIPILEDNAFSLFSKVDGRPFGTFGDISIFSLRKNLPLLEGGMLRLNNSAYNLELTEKKAPLFYPIARYIWERLRLDMRFPPPPLYSERSGFPDWPWRDKISGDFSCNYLRPMSILAKRQLAKVSESDFFDISNKKRLFFVILAEKIRQLGIKEFRILWPVLAEGAVPFCLSLLIDRNRDVFFDLLRKKYSVMVWPTLPGEVIAQLGDFPEVELLGRRLLQINLPTSKVRSAGFTDYIDSLIKDLRNLSSKYL